jgi:hypothetical protein
MVERNAKTRNRKSNLTHFTTKGTKVHEGNVCTFCETLACLASRVIGAVRGGCVRMLALP